MAKAFHPVVLTASDLLDGDAVWWTGADWSRDIAKAAVASDRQAADAFETLIPSPAFAAAVVGPYLVELAPGARLRPLVRREAIRADREPTFAYGEAARLRDAA